MRTKYSISATHGGQNKVSIPHNRRYKRYVEQSHIDPNGFHEAWIHQELDSAYKELFSKAKKEYNELQKSKGRASRQIRDYRRHCRDSKQTNEVYEVIFTIGNRDKRPSEHTSREVLKDVVAEFEKQNPNIKIVGAYYHADEPGAAPHVHVDYIPFSHGHKRGLSVQNNLSGALKEMGFKTEHAGNTAQMRWQESVYDMVEAVCRRNGLDVVRGVSKHDKHIDTELFKKQTESKELDRKRLGQEHLLAVAEKEVRETKLELAKVKRDKNSLENKVAELRDELGTLEQAQSRINALEKENSRLKRVLDTFQRAWDIAESYLKTKPLKFSDGFIGTVWDSMKNKLFNGLGKNGYTEFQATRHNDDNPKKVVHRPNFDR